MSHNNTYVSPISEHNTGEDWRAGAVIVSRGGDGVTTMYYPNNVMLL